MPFGSSLLGALVGALALWLVFRSEQQERKQAAVERQEERFVSSLAEVLTSMTTLAAKLGDYDQALKARAFRMQAARISPNAMGESGPSPIRPDFNIVLGRIEVARMIGGAEQREALRIVMEAVVMLSSYQPHENVTWLLVWAARVRRWRTGELSLEDLQVALKNPPPVSRIPEQRSRAATENV